MSPASTLEWRCMDSRCRWIHVPPFRFSYFDRCHEDRSRQFSRGYIGKNSTSRTALIHSPTYLSSALLRIRIILQSTPTTQIDSSHARLLRPARPAGHRPRTKIRYLVPQSSYSHHDEGPFSGPVIWARPSNGALMSICHCTTAKQPDSRSYSTKRMCKLSSTPLSSVTSYTIYPPPRSMRFSSLPFCFFLRRSICPYTFDWLTRSISRLPPK